MSLNYAREKLSNAVYALATREGALKERLEAACREISYLATAADFDMPTDLPDDVKDEIRALIEQVTQVNDPWDGSIAATVRGLDAETARELARTIVRLYDEVIGP